MTTPPEVTAMTISQWLAASLLVVATGSRAEWPEQPIKIIVPFAPGASTDIVIRQVAPKVSEILKQSVVIENRGGAGGLIGSEAVIAAPADGYTLLAATTSYTALPALTAKMPFDTQKDFAPIGLVADMPGIIVVPAKSPANTFKEFLEYAKKNKLNYGS